MKKFSKTVLTKLAFALAFSLMLVSCGSSGDSTAQESSNLAEIGSINYSNKDPNGLYSHNNWKKAVPKNDILGLWVTSKSSSLALFVNDPNSARPSYLFCQTGPGMVKYRVQYVPRQLDIKPLIIAYTTLESDSQKISNFKAAIDKPGTYAINEQAVQVIAPTVDTLVWGESAHKIGYKIEDDTLTWYKGNIRDNKDMVEILKYQEFDTNNFWILDENYNKTKAPECSIIQKS